MKFALIALSRKYHVSESLKRVICWVNDSNNTLIATSETKMLIDEKYHSNFDFVPSDEEAIERCDVVISVGGDGTLLRAARLVMHHDKPILGINSGRLGFLANIPREHIENALDYTANRNFEVDRRFMLEAETSDGKIHHALNEFLFSKGSSGSMISLNAYYDDVLINRYWSDGIIIAGPTGSTAYNMSCGGPIITPSADVMILNPINPHTLTTRPLVLSASKPITIKAAPSNQVVLFSKDGEICDISSAETEAKIRRSDFTIDLIKLPGQTYFDTLRNKLMWGMDIRDTFTNT